MLRFWVFRGAVLPCGLVSERGEEASEGDGLWLVAPNSCGGATYRTQHTQRLTQPAVPVRNTDFAHLRDGFTRTLLARQRTQRQAGTLSPDKDEAITTAIQQLKSLFPAGSVPKGRELVIVRTPDEQLAVEYEGKVMGRVADAWVADNMVLAYFDAKSPISPPVSLVRWW